MSPLAPPSDPLLDAAGLSVCPTAKNATCLGQKRPDTRRLARESTRNLSRVVDEGARGEP